jgi:phosphatidyl-myo-inositol dimannoside synthase
VRSRFGAAPESTLVVSVSRLVPRKGMDVLIRAAARLAPVHPDLEVLIGGTGRDADRLGKLVAELGAPVRLLGRVDDADLPGALRRRRRVRDGVPKPLDGPGAGGLRHRVPRGGRHRGRPGGRAAAAGPPKRSPTATGLVVGDPTSVAEVAAALRRLVVDPGPRRRWARRPVTERWRSSPTTCSPPHCAELNAWRPR